MATFKKMDMIIPNDDFMEVFSMPRIVPEVQRLGLRAIRSMDRLNGWNLDNAINVGNAFEEVWKRQPSVMLLSPPCTIFSKMQDTNWHRIEPQKLKAWAIEGVHLLNVAIWLCKYQWHNNRKFILEHPAKAKSWQRQDRGALRVKVSTARFGCWRAHLGVSNATFISGIHGGPWWLPWNTNHFTVVAEGWGMHPLFLGTR
jgi:hypothetical protein